MQYGASIRLLLVFTYMKSTSLDDRADWNAANQERPPQSWIDFTTKRLKKENGHWRELQRWRKDQLDRRNRRIRELEEEVRALRGEMSRREAEPDSVLSELRGLLGKLNDGSKMVLKVYQYADLLRDLAISPVEAADANARACALERVERLRGVWNIM